MIIRVIIHVDTVGRKDLGIGDRIFFHSCKIYTDEQKALEDTDEELNNFNLNDGCSLSSDEDFLALNAQLAERFSDPYNQDAYAQWEDITEKVRDKIYNDFYDFNWPTELLTKMSEECGIDYEDI